VQLYRKGLRRIRCPEDRVACAAGSTQKGLRLTRSLEQRKLFWTNRIRSPVKRIHCPVRLEGVSERQALAPIDTTFRP
jgi:hypothetical protein